MKKKKLYKTKKKVHKTRLAVEVQQRVQMRLQDGQRLQQRVCRHGAHRALRLAVIMNITH